MLTTQNAREIIFTRSVAAQALELAAACLIVAGAWLLAEWLALIVAGLLFLVASYSLGR